MKDQNIRATENLRRVAIVPRTAAVRTATIRVTRIRNREITSSATDVLHHRLRTTLTRTTQTNRSVRLVTNRTINLKSSKITILQQLRVNQ